MPLTLKIIEEAQPGINAKGNITDKPYKIGDSGGLFLLVTPSAGKWWRFKYRYGGKEKQLSLGTYPLVSLIEARTKREEFRALLKDCIDPTIHIKADREARLAEEVRQEAESRFTLENDGGLSLRLEKRYLALTPAETFELRSFLDTTRAVTLKENPCL